MFFRIWQIHFIRNYEPRAQREHRIVQINLPPQTLQVFYWIASLASGDVHHENQNAAARNVTQKFVTQAEPAVRPFDQPRNIRGRGAAVTWKFNDANDWM